MFHNSSTLHHNRNLFPATSRESRLIHLNWFANKRLQAAVFWDYMRGPRRLARMYSWAFGWPLIKGAVNYGIQGLGKAVDGVEWTTQMAIEAGKGALQTTVSPLAMMAKSRLTMVKRMLWDLPIATASAIFRMPIALARSPLEMIRGVRDAVVSIPKNVGEVLNSVYQLKIGETLKNIRKTVSDVLLPPITRPLGPIFAPVGHFVDTAVSAEAQTWAVAGKIIKETIPEGARRIWNSPKKASAIMEEIQANRLAMKAAMEQEELARKEALKEAVAAEKGEGGKGGGGKGGGAKGK